MPFLGHVFGILNVLKLSKKCPKEMPIGRPRNDLGLKCPGGVWAVGGDPQLGGPVLALAGWGALSVDIPVGPPSTGREPKHPSVIIAFVYVLLPEVVVETDVLQASEACSSGV